MSNITKTKKEFIQNKKISANRIDFLITKQNIDRNLPPIINHLNINKNNLDDENYLFVTANETPNSISFLKTFHNDIKMPSDINSFLLLRIKLNIVFYYKTYDGKYGYTKIPSELVDISISKQVSYDLILNYKNFTSKIVKYRYIYEGNTNINFIGYSPNGYVSDINKIFFYEREYPWNDPKYEKRLYRLCYFFILALKERKIQLSRFIVLMLNYINSILINTIDIQTNFASIINFLLENNLNDDNFYFIQTITLINKNIVIKPLNPIYINDYNNFFNILKVIFEKLEKIEQTEKSKLNISEFSFSKFTETETESDSKFIKIDQLGGNF